MRSLVLALLLSAVSLHAQTIPSVVQHVGKDCGGSALSCAVPLNTPSVPGNAIIVLGRLGGTVGAATPIGSVTDDVGNTYALAVKCLQPTDPHMAMIFSTTGATKSAKTVTLSGTNNTSARAEVIEAANVGVLDQTACKSGSGTIADSGSLTPSTANELVVALTTTGNPATANIASPMTFLDSATKVFDAFEAPAPAAAVDPTFTLTSGGGLWASAAVSFAPGIPPPPANSSVAFACSPSFPNVTFSAFVPSGAKGYTFALVAGAAPLTITQITPPAGFVMDAIPALPVTIAPADSQTFTIRFVPTSTGTFGGNVTFIANVPNGNFQMGVQAVAQ